MASKHSWCLGNCESCEEHPERFAGAGLGMYHCLGPNCGMLVLAGIEHPTCAELDSQINDAEGALVEEWLNAD